MDAQSIDVEQKRRTRMDGMKFSEEVQQLRSDMLEVEDKIVEDLDRLKELLTPYRIANYILFMLGEELLERMKTVDWARFEDVSKKAQKSIKDHKLMSALLGAGATGLLFYGVLQYQKSGRSESPKIKIEATGVPESKDRQYS